MLNATVPVTGAFVREHLRAPLTLTLLVAVPALFVLIFASVLGEFATALGGTLAERSATSISAGWAAAFLAGTLAFFQVSSSRGADRRLALAGLGPGRVASARIAAAVVLALAVSIVAFATLALRTGIEHPAHAAAAIVAFALIYIGVGAAVGAVVRSPLEGSLIVVLAFSLDVFSGPRMTSNAGLAEWTPTRDAAEVLVAAGGGVGSPQGDWLALAAAVGGSLAVAFGAFLLVARRRG
ncbi:MAG TPA: hypothetical protein VK919_10310 [Solirubrobacterales bacterium]|nr:hypothetical protein [Solirubrobacterales bacterium]